MCAHVCVLLHLLHTEYQNTNSTSNVRNFLGSGGVFSWPLKPPYVGVKGLVGRVMVRVKCWVLFLCVIHYASVCVYVCVLLCLFLLSEKERSIQRVDVKHPQLPLASEPWTPGSALCLGPTRLTLICPDLDFNCDLDLSRFSKIATRSDWFWD